MLILAVLSIWGIIGYKIISALNPETPKIAHAEFNTTFTPKVNTTLDTFSIQTVERDPFLGNLYAKKVKDTTPKIISYREEFVWIPILYHGMVSKQNSDEKTCILSINGQQQLMKVGQEVNEVKLIKANNIEVFLSYKGKRKVIQKT